MLLRFDPFRAFDQLNREVFDGTAGIASGWMPMDVVRTGDSVEVAFDLPGIDPSSVELTTRRNVLTVRAERRLEPTEGAEPIIRQRPQGTFTRSLYLPDSVDLDKAVARYDNGVLTVSAPVAESAKPHRIEVEGRDTKALTTGEPAKEAAAV
jgi:HSP20 family protein